MQITETHDKWFKQVLRDNGISISDNPSSVELLMIENENNIKVKRYLFSMQVYIDDKLAGEYVSEDFDYL
jgi:hypothetical protein